MTEVGWLYALELAPSGWIKVGRSAELVRRLAAHATAAAFGDSVVVQVAAARTLAPVQRERQLIDAVGALQGAVVVHGRETFAGVAFPDVAALVRQHAERVDPVRVVAPQHQPAQPGALVLVDHPDLLQDITEIMGAAAHGGWRWATPSTPHIGLAVLLCRLQDQRTGVYGPWDVHALGAMLRARNVRLGTVRVDGVAVWGLKWAWLLSARREHGMPEVGLTSVPVTDKKRADLGKQLAVFSDDQG